MACWEKQQLRYILKDSSYYTVEIKMPSEKQQKIKCFKLRFSGIEQPPKAPECPPSNDLEKKVAEMLKKREEQDKNLFRNK
jgi:hypothetical protein